MGRNSKVKGFERVSPQERNEVVFDLIYALTSCKTIEEAAVLIEDLLTQAELEFISRRLRIARLLLEDMTYSEIKTQLHVSDSTISKIAAWLSQKGDGFRSVVKSFPKKKNARDPLYNPSWTSMKRRYPSYFLPERMIEQIVSMANKRQKGRLLKIINEMDESLKEKSELHKSIEGILKSNK